MTVETILTCILFATLRTDNVSVLVLEMNILDVALQGHLVEIWSSVNFNINKLHQKLMSYLFDSKGTVSDCFSPF